jgi:hypothetical protein
LLHEEGTMGKPTIAQLTEQMRVDRENFLERISELELELEDVGWQSAGNVSRTEFSRAGLRKICEQSLLFWMKNPLVRRGVKTQANYVFGQGVTVSAPHPVVNEVVQAFMEDKKNQTAYTGIHAMVKAEKDLWITGNLFFMLFSNNRGGTRISLVPFDEIEAVECNPEDRNEQWYYLRAWTEGSRLMGRRVNRRVWYPDWLYRPDDKREEIEGDPVDWDHPLYHVKVNAVLDQAFGTSELYAVQAWAQAYNKFLADWATIVRSYARFAWDIVKKTAKGRLAMKTALDSKIAGGDYQAPPSVGSAFIHDDATRMSPIKTAGATTSADDGRRLLLMVCAEMGLPETFFGDVSVGTLATARSLNRPTELQFSLRQLLHKEILENLCGYAVRQAAEYGHGALSGAWEPDDWDGERFVYANDVTNEDEEKRDKPIDTTVNVSFPPLVEEDTNKSVEAVVNAATLAGNPLAGTLDAKYTTGRLLTALGETDIEDVMAKLFPEPKEGEEAQAVSAAVADLQGAIEALSEAQDRDREEVVRLLASTFVQAFKEAQG